MTAIGSIVDISIYRSVGGPGWRTFLQHAFVSCLDGSAQGRMVVGKLRG